MALSLATNTACNRSDHWGGRTKKKARQRLPAAPRSGDTELENELAAKLHRAGTVVVGDRSEVPVVGARIDALEVHMVEGIEGLEAQLNSRSFVSGDRDALEQREIPVEDSRPHG